MGSLVCRHFLVDRFHVEILKVYSERMLNQVSTEELEALEVLAEEHDIVLVSLLENLDVLGSNSLQLFPNN